jgi:hypothetical protein
MNNKFETVLLTIFLCCVVVGAFFGFEMHMDKKEEKPRRDMIRILETLQSNPHWHTVDSLVGRGQGTAETVSKALAELHYKGYVERRAVPKRTPEFCATGKNPEAADGLAGALYPDPALVRCAQ